MCNPQCFRSWNAVASSMPSTEEPSDLRFRRAMFRQSRASPRRFPWRESSDPYEVLIGEVLLQRTRGEHVVSVYQEFLRRWPDAEALATAPQESIARVIHPLGLPKRASILKQLGQAITERGDVPRTPAELDRLPGVGRYGAHAVPIFALHRNLPLVDWVIARVLRRYFGFASGSRPNADAELWAAAGRLAQRRRARELWLGVLDFADAVCKPRPRCSECPLRRSCASPVLPDQT